MELNYIQDMRKIILIRGAIAAGKSSLVKELQRLLNDVSVIDMDAFKRMIDYKSPSLWRTSTAFNTALFLAEKLMLLDRTIVVDIHSSKEYQFLEYQALAKKNNYEMVSFLLYPPLQVCLERNRSRIITDVIYKITDDTVKEYWEELFKVEGEKVYDTSDFTPETVAKDIVTYLT